MTDQPLAAPRLKPFEGVKVIDISNFLAAPMSAMFLADFGADVVKIERPGSGDEVRYWGRNKNGVGLYYKILGRGKKSVTADLRTPFGVEVVKRLVKDADILVENYRTGTLEKWGIGPDVLHGDQSGPDHRARHRLRPDRPLQGPPGLRHAGRGLRRLRAHQRRAGCARRCCRASGLPNSTTGLMAAFLASAALHEKRRSGKGQVIDLAIYETLFTLLGPQVIDYDQLGQVQQRQGSRLPFTAPRNTYRSKDGKWVSIAGSAQSTFERICKALEIPRDGEAYPRFLDNRLRLENAKALDEVLQAAHRPVRLRRADAPVPGRRCADRAGQRCRPDFRRSAIHRAREHRRRSTDEELGGPVRMQNVVGKFSATPGKISSAGPKLGAHNREILIERLGFTEAEVERGDGGQRLRRPIEAPEATVRRADQVR